MSIQNQYSYYEKYTNKYNNLIEKCANSIISNGHNKPTFYLDPENFHELSIDILQNLKRITNEIDNQRPIRDSDIISKNDDITIVQLSIEDNITEAIHKKGFKVDFKDEMIKISKCK